MLKQHTHTHKHKHAHTHTHIHIHNQDDEDERTNSDTPRTHTNGSTHASDGYGSSDHLSRVMNGESITSQYQEYVRSVHAAEEHAHMDSDSANIATDIHVKTRTQLVEESMQSFVSERPLEEGNRGLPMTHFGFTLAYQSSRRALWRVSDGSLFLVEYSKTCSFGFMLPVKARGERCEGGE